MQATAEAMPVGVIDLGTLNGDYHVHGDARSSILGRSEIICSKDLISAFCRVCIVQTGGRPLSRGLGERRHCLAYLPGAARLAEGVP